MITYFERKKPTPWERSGQPAVIKYRIGAGKTHSNTWEFTKPNDSAWKMIRVLVFDWDRLFTQGRADINEDRIRAVSENGPKV